MNKNINYDLLIKDFIKEWENDESSPSMAVVKKALSGILIPDLYKKIREEVLGETKIPAKKFYFHRSEKIFAVINHVFWYLLWTLKWFTLKKSAKKIILASFFPLNKSTVHYLEVLNIYAEQNKAAVIHFSVLFGFKNYFNKNIYCYPHALLKRKVNADDFNRIYQNFTSKLNILSNIHFNFPFEDSVRFRLLVLNYYEIKISFEHLIENIYKKCKILFLIQDCDYLTDRVLFSIICRNHKIKTAAFDHSIQLFDHIFYNSNSDIHFVWGEHQQQRISNYTNEISKSIVVTGRPGNYFSEYKSDEEKKYWIYILPAFQEAHMQSIYRSFDYTMQLIDLILSSSNVNGKNLLIKKHPSDSTNIFNSSKIKIYEDRVQTVLSSTELIITEDSTMSIEVLQFMIPIVYVLDKKNEDNLHLKKYSADITTFSIEQNIDEVISKALQSKINVPERKKMFQFYLNDCRNFKSNVLMELNKLK